MGVSEKVVAVIAAAGRSQRMGGGDKLFTLLGGKPVLVRTVNVFQVCPLVSEVVIVLAPDKLDLGRGLAEKEGWSKVSAVCAGGLRRYDSVAAGLKRIEECDWVIVHDGARPLVTEELISRGLTEAKETGAAVAAVPVSDTIKIAGKGLLVRRTPRRQNLWAVQTPQVFRFDIVRQAYREIKGEVTDDASLVEKLGYRVKLYSGSYRNIKLTTPTDLVLLRALWRKRNEA